MEEVRDVLIALNRYESEDGTKTGVWAALEDGLAEAVDGNCKIAELGGEVVLTLGLACVAPEAIADKTLSNIIRALKAYDAFADAINPAGYVLKFASDGIGHLLDGADNVFLKISDGSYSGKVLSLDDGKIINIPTNEVEDITPSLNSTSEKLEFNLDNKSYQLIDQALATRYLALSSELQDLIDNFGFGSLKLADNGEDIIFLASNGTDEIARIVDSKFTPSKWMAYYFDEVDEVIETESGYWILKTSDGEAFDIGFKKEGQRQLSAEEVNAYHEEARGNSAPYKEGTYVDEEVLTEGDVFYVIELKSKEAPGGWASTKKYTSKEEARNELALINNFKDYSKDWVVVEYTVLEGKKVRVRNGIVGSQYDAENAIELLGGGQQYEIIEDFKNNWDQFVSRGTPVLLN